ncbi:hypothetical protein Tco_1202609 [Tanacetum coccineum]
MLRRIWLLDPIPNVDDDGEILHTVMVEYEWEPPRWDVCTVFGHDDMLCPKRPVKPKKPIWQIVSKRNSASSSGTKKNSQVSKKVMSPTNPFDALNTIGEGDELGSNGGSSNSGKKVAQDVAGSTSGSPGKLVLLDDEGKPLKPSKSILPNYSVSKKVDDLVNEDSDSEVKDIYDEIATYLASTSFNVNKTSKSSSG